MKNHFSILIIALFLFSCNSNKQTEKKSEADTSANKSTTAANLNPVELISGIDAEVNRIKSLKLVPKKFEVVCDEKATVSYFRENNNIVKVVVDWGMVGDFATVDEYYYKNQKLIFAYEVTEGGVGNGPNEKYEFKSYVDNDKTIRYLNNQKEIPCTVCQYSDTLREYQVLKADNLKDVTSAVCR